MLDPEGAIRRMAKYSDDDYDVTLCIEVGGPARPSWILFGITQHNGFDEATATPIQGMFKDEAGGLEPMPIRAGDLARAKKKLHATHDWIWAELDPRDRAEIGQQARNGVDVWGAL